MCWLPCRRCISCSSSWKCQSLQVELNKMIELKKLRDENIAKMQIQPCTVAHPPTEYCSMSTFYVYMFLLRMALKMIFGHDIHVKYHIRQFPVSFPTCAQGMDNAETQPMMCELSPGFGFQPHFCQICISGNQIEWCACMFLEVPFLQQLLCQLKGTMAGRQP